MEEIVREAKTRAERSTLAVAVALALAVGGCTASPLTEDIHIGTNQAARLDLSSVQTYQWLANSIRVRNDSSTWHPPGFDVDTELRRLVDARMRQRGWVEVDAGGDLGVSYQLLASIEELAYGDLLPGLPADAQRAGGVIVIDLVSRSASRKVFMGMATTDQMAFRDDDEVKRRLAHVVERIFADLP